MKLQLLTDERAHLGGGQHLFALCSDVRGAMVGIQHVLNGGFDGVGLSLQDIMAQERMVAIGFAMPLPAISGAEP